MSFRGDAKRRAESITAGRRIWIPDLPLSRQSGMTGALSSLPDSTHIVAMAKGPNRRDPAKHSKKDPAKPTRAKAARPDAPQLDDSLADLLNPGIGQGTAGLGSQTGLQQPPDNSWDRRADFANAHRARASVARGFGEAPQQGYVGKSPAAPGELDPD